MSDMDERRWFLSYASHFPMRNEVGFGCAVVATGEHPVALIARWNRERNPHVLLFYRELSADEDVPEFNAEILPW
jgi:hypothetical protein